MASRTAAIAASAAILLCFIASANASAIPVSPDIRNYILNTTRVPANSTFAEPAGAAQLRDLLNKTAAAGTYGDRSSFLDGLASDIFFGVQEAKGRCVWGLNCGSKCGWTGYGAPADSPASYGGEHPQWTDDLDLACVRHDRCLQQERWDEAGTYCLAPGMQGMVCHCERELRDTARGIYEREKGCPWWNIFCVESDRVAAALAIYQAIGQRAYCGSCDY
ncbi:hypothetical protein DFJ74DRAFT_769385 [Hyaloraphidium curvatum]|nr:hypothetical protein DFJ74DRAFT_769385 [Hyaloraphidium curvatum]